MCSSISVWPRCVAFEVRHAAFAQGLAPRAPAVRCRARSPPPGSGRTALRPAARRRRGSPGRGWRARSRRPVPPATAIASRRFSASRGHRLAVGHDQVGVGAVVRTADAAAQLVQLRQAEAVGAVDDDGVGGRHVDAGLDDRGADQHVEALAVEIQHRPASSSRSGIWPWATRMRASGTSRLEFARGPLDASRPRCAGNTPARRARARAAKASRELRVVPLGDEGLDRQPVRRRGGDDRQVAQARHGHVQRARDRRGGEREQVDLGAQLACNCSFWRTPKRCSSSTITRPRSLKRTSSLQQLVRADHDVDLAVGELLQRLVDFLLRAEARQQLDP